ncbi:MAG: hypothetical protein AAGU32_16150 [Bacillota bacterium]
MEKTLDELLHDLDSKDDAIRKAAFDYLFTQTEMPVNWLDDVFETLACKLTSPNSFQRNIGVMLLSNLAKSDLSGRLAAVIGPCMALLEDEKFITTRMAAQSVWKIGAAQVDLRPQIVDGLMRTLNRSHMNPHPNLIRQDIVSSLMRLHSEAPNSVDIEQINKYIAANCAMPEKKRLMALMP